MNKVVILSAPSGSGKTTVVHFLLNEFPELAFSISATTRKQRGKEEDGKDYYFLTKEEFEKKIDNNEFLEYEEVYPGRYYGTLKSEVTRLWEIGKVVVFDVDVVGGLSIKKHFDKQALAVFLRPPSIEELRKRLEARNTENGEEVEMRVGKAKKEITFEERFDIVLINNTLTHTLIEVKSLINYFINKQ